MITVLADSAEMKTDGRMGLTIFRRVRFVAGSARGREAEVLALAQELLLAPDASSERRRVGIALVAHLGSPEARAMLETAVDDRDSRVREVAIEHLARRPEPRHLPILKRLFGEESPLALRIYAAGGLVRLGETGEALDWLLKTAEARELDPDLRRRVLGRLAQGPVERVRDVFARALSGEEWTLEQKKELIRDLHFCSWGRNVEQNTGSTPSLLSALTEIIRDPELAPLLKGGRPPKPSPFF
jgi:hypothetical protein